MRQGRAVRRCVAPDGAQWFYLADAQLAPDGAQGDRAAWMGSPAPAIERYAAGRNGQRERALLLEPTRRAARVVQSESGPRVAWAVNQPDPDPAREALFRRNPASFVEPPSAGRIIRTCWAVLHWMGWPRTRADSALRRRRA